MTFTGKPLPSDWATGIYWHEAAAFVGWLRGEGYRVSVKSDDYIGVCDPETGELLAAYRIFHELRCANAPHVEQPFAKHFLATLSNRTEPPRKPASIHEVAQAKPPLNNGRCVDCHEFALICEC